MSVSIWHSLMSDTISICDLANFVCCSPVCCLNCPLHSSWSTAPSVPLDPVSCLHCPLRSSRSCLLLTLPPPFLSILSVAYTAPSVPLDPVCCLHCPLRSSRSCRLLTLPLRFFRSTLLLILPVCSSWSILLLTSVPQLLSILNDLLHVCFATLLPKIIRGSPFAF